MKEKEKYTGIFTINVNDFLIGLNKTLEECSNSVFIGLSSIENLNEVPESIFAEDNFNIHSPFGQNYTIEERKTIYKKWLIKKGFEDLTKGIVNLLVEISNFYNFHSKSKLIKEYGEFQKLISEPNFENTKKHLPELLTFVKSKLKEDLFYVEEINSINQLRNCLVHRNGIVTPKDLKNNGESLNLVWQYPKIIFFENENEIEFHKNIVINGNGEIKTFVEKKNREFRINENVEISYQLFNELIFTCHLFGNDLINKLTLDNEK